MTSSSTPRYFPKRNENLCSQNYLYMNVYIFIQNSSKQEGTQMPFNCWEDKQRELCPRKRILHNNKKEVTTERFYNTAESQKLFTKRKSLDTKGHILHDSIHMRF